MQQMKNWKTGASQSRAVHGPQAAALSPEETLRAIFTQVFAGEQIHLPEGASIAGLRAAVSLNPEIISGIFESVKTQAEQRRKAEARPASKRRGPLRAVMAIFGGLFLAAVVLIYHFSTVHQQVGMPPAVSTGQLYEAAPEDKAALAALMKRAELGDATAQFDLGTMLDSHFLSHEKTVVKNNTEAFRWYLTAANSGLAAAENNLGFAYQMGRGVAPDYAMAAKWYRAAADAGLANAQNSLGGLYQNGIGVPRDDKQAFQLYQKAALQGLAAAQNNLGAAYEAGQGTAKDYSAAVSWFNLAAAQGEPNAQNSLGYLYYNGLGVPRDFVLAFKWLSAASAQGMASAQLNLGLLYLQGAGVNQDTTTAAKWFLLAEERGDKDAATALGLIIPPLTAEQRAAASAAAKNWDSQAQGPK
jgi:TPR repeat protein